MIFNVIWTYVLVRGSAVNNGTLPYGKRRSVATFGRDPQTARPQRQRSPGDGGPAAAYRRHAGVPDHRAALQAPAHLPGADQRHLQAAAQRLGRCCPSRPTASRSTSKIRRGRPIRRGKIEDFTWKAMLDFATCTECGRCQSQCPA
ncbi:putative IRON-SULFUR-BINDING REDUCTASE domain protein [Mycobacterium xenopi 4042]|uniref:Putative IRON-SULFUR-BINDING REDUCTASE domain protein n=1 Tax=Mycobacterium xenopi 4042 TaxID=1299334 RepID=X7ZAC0_MYCXE|nr:putative IRON-SULFUR-BINDING REDUCTASE domain protein [Mycobacterium xenopi 4042]